MSQTRVSATAADAVRDRYRASFAGAFVPSFATSKCRVRKNVPPMRRNLSRTGSGRSTRSWGVSSKSWSEHPLNPRRLESRQSWRPTGKMSGLTLM